MKKIIMMVLFFALAVSVFAQNGVIREITGEVEIKHSGASSFIPAAAGAVVNLNTIISTGFRSTAVVVIGNSTLTVRPLTRLSLAEIQSTSNSESVNVNLQAGRVRVDVNPPSGTKANFTVQSPSATASVRGTSFEFDMVNVSVEKGKVAFSGKTGPAAMVGSGNTTFVSAEGTAVNPVEVKTASLTPTAPAGIPESKAAPAVITAPMVISINWQ